MPASLPIPSRFPNIVHAEHEVQTHHPYSWDNRLRVPKGTIVIQRTLEGCCLLEDATGIQEVAPDKAMIFVYGEKSRYFRDPEDARPYRLEWVVLSPQGGIEPLVSQIRADFGSCVAMKEKGEGALILSTIVQRFKGAGPRNQLDLAELAYRLLLAVYREQVSRTQGEDPVAYLRHLLQTQFRSPQNIKEWTHELPMSREHLSRVFKNRYKETPAACLRRLRLDHAHLLAQSSHMPTEDIAAASGFANAQTLRRAFKEHFGVPIRSL